MFSLALILLVIIAPLYISEGLEEIETAQEGLISRDELHSTSNTTSTYVPFVEMNEETEGWVNPGSGGLDYGYSFNVGGATWDDPALKSYNIDEYLDYVDYTQETLDYGYIYMKGDFYTLAQEGITGFYFSFTSNNEYAYIQTRFLELDVSYLEIDNHQVHYSQWDTDPHTGFTEYEVTLTSTDLTELLAMYNGVDPARQVLRLYINFVANDGSDFYTDIQFEPEYYQQNTTTYQNTTTTIYEPYVQHITPYKVQKVGMVIGSILIIGIGWIASPWGETLDGILPINQHTNNPRRRKP